MSEELSSTGAGVLPKSLYSNHLLTHVAMQHYVYGVPLGRVEWDRLRDDLDELQEFTVHNPGKTFVIRSQTLGDAGKALQAVGVALGPTVRLPEEEST